MKNKVIPIMFVVIVIIAIIVLVVYSNTSQSNINNNVAGSLDQNNSSINTIIDDSNNVVTDYLNTEQFTDRDRRTDYTDSDYVTITLGDNNTSVSNIQNVSVAGNVITITDEGTYLLAGSLSEGQIVVEAEKTDKIQLVLKNVTISSASTSPIYVKQADKVFITLDNNSVNTLSTTGEYVAIDENNIDSVIFSKEDLTLNGNGTLNLTSKYGHGIVSKDDFVITGGVFNIEAGGHGLSGKDSVRVADGTFNIKSVDKGIRAVNDDDNTLGYIYIEDGSFVIDSEDDALHSSLDIYINGGNFTIYAKDDAIHADSTIIINNGDINIKESYEGIEAKNIEINGGDISLVSSDDGLNAAGGNDSSGNMNMFGKKDKGGFDAVEDAYIKILGGKLVVDASGDGLDSNGNLYISGGEIYVFGPTNTGNGALDYNGEASITSGVCVALGMGGMAQNFGNNSTQGSILVNLNSIQSAGTNVSLLDSNGNILITFSATKQFNSIVISTPEIESGETYTLQYGSGSQFYSQEITMTSLIYGSGSGMGDGMKDGMHNKPVDMPAGVPGEITF